MGSRIPIFGLVHKLDIVRYNEADDGMGGVVLGSATYVYRDYRGRVTILSGQNDVANQDVTEIFGNISQQRWRFTVKYCPDVQRSDFVKLSSGSKAAPIPFDTLYRVIWIKHQIDDQGKFHHTSLIGELEDQDNTPVE